jgi:hypothetical protein
MLPPTTLPVGGGWSQDVVGSSQLTKTSKKRSFDTSELSAGSSKRQRAVDSDTATEPETDDEVAENTEMSARAAAETILAACNACHPDRRIAPPKRGTYPPPPSGNATPSTVLETQRSDASISLGGSAPPSRSFGEPLSQNALPSLPSLVAPLQGPVHARLRAKLLKRYLDGADREAEAADAAQADASNANAPNEPWSNDADEVPETTFNSPTTSECATRGSLSTRSNLNTYAGSRSHLLSGPEIAIVEPSNANNIVDSPIQPNSPSLTPAQMIRRERTRAAAAKAHAHMPELAPRRCQGLFASAAQPPTSRYQSRPTVGGRGNSVGQRMGGPRRLDPVSAARSDMLAFNRAVAEGEAASFVESVTRQSERTARCAPPLSRPSDGLLEDDEEMLAQAEAYAKSKWPVS